MAIERTWNKIETWLQNNAPDELQAYNPPASEQNIAAAERGVGHELPDDFKAFLRIHDGTDFAHFIEHTSLLAGQVIVDSYGILKATPPGGRPSVRSEYVDSAIHPVHYSDDWVPFAHTATGRTSLCFDYAPTADGRKCQVISVQVDGDKRRCLAPGFAELLELFLEQLETGAIHIPTASERAAAKDKLLAQLLRPKT